MSTATLISAFMERHSLSQNRLAALLGVSQAAVNRWQHGRRRESSSRMVELALRSLERELAQPTATAYKLYDLACPEHGAVDGTSWAAQDSPLVDPPVDALVAWGQHRVSAACALRPEVRARSLE